VKRIYFFLFVFLLQALVMRSQTDSIRQLHEIVVGASRSDQFNPGFKIIRLDSGFLAQFSGSNLAEALSYDGSIALKQYGNTGLTSTSFRGASAAQTPIIWNGFNIQSPMYGQVDLSLFPVGTNDKISLQYGAGSTEWGSGAVSGAIVLENEPGFNKGFGLGFNSLMGSFGTYNNLLHLDFGSEKFAASVKAYYNTSENNFSFNNTSIQGAPLIKQTHAWLYNYGSIARLDYKIGNHQLVSINAWYQYSNRQIPPLMIQLKSASFQEDEGYKITAEWKYMFQHSAIKIRSGVFNDQLNYNDSLSALFSRSHSLSSISEIEYSISKKQTLFQVGVNATYHQASSDGYAMAVQQWHNSLFGLLKWTSSSQKIHLHISLRKEMVDGELIYPTVVVKDETKHYKALPTAGVGLDLGLLKWFRIRANAASLYRIPTLNDLYWNPGGNPGLKPEEGISEELTLSLLLKKKNLNFLYDVTGFNRNISNWIIWLPGDYYWSPENILKVWSRGFEHVATVEYIRNKFSVKLSLNYTYTLSTNQKAKSENDASLDKQLIYTPVHQGGAKLMLMYYRWYASYLYSYTGYRYTSEDNLDYLPGFGISKITIGKNTVFKKMEIGIGLSCNNIFNVQYQSVLWRAMPGRSYSVTLKVNFLNKNNKIN
jgi:vitamin B12 transporter